MQNMLLNWIKRRRWSEVQVNVLREKRFTFITVSVHRNRSSSSFTVFGELILRDPAPNFQLGLTRRVHT